MQISFAERNLRKVSELPDLSTSERAANSIALHFYDKVRDRYNERNRKRREKKNRPGGGIKKNQSFTI